MNQSIIIEQLTNEKNKFITFINSLNDELLRYKPNESKWNCAEQMYHLSTSAISSTLPYQLPAFIVRILFGKVQFKQRSLEELKQQYTDKLNKGAQATGKFAAIDKAQEMNKEELIKQFDKAYTKLLNAISNCTEENLDACQIPHPLLKKISLRELAYFTIFHTEHHLISMKMMLENK